MSTYQHIYDESNVQYKRVPRTVHINKYIYIPPCASAVLCVTLCYNDNAVTTDNRGLEVWLDTPQSTSNHISFADHITPRFLVVVFGKVSQTRGMADVVVVAQEVIRLTIFMTLRLVYK